MWRYIYIYIYIYAAKSRQSCPTLCDPIDGSPPSSRPWDSPGNNTGVGCHFLLQCMEVKSESEVAQSNPTLCDPMDCSLPGSSVHGISHMHTIFFINSDIYIYIHTHTHIYTYTYIHQYSHLENSMDRGAWWAIVHMVANSWT